MCTLGKEGGVCACVDQPLLGDPPTFYFVLDRSGSMSAPWDGTPGSPSKWATVLTELQHLVVALGPRASYAAAVFPDPRFDGCSAGREVFPAAAGLSAVRGDAPAGTLGPHEQALLSALAQGSPSGGTPTAATLVQLASRISSLPGKRYVIFATDGGPNCNSGVSCTFDQCTENIDGAPGCPPLGPINCCIDPNWGSGQGCLDAQPTIAAVEAIARAGIPVYVVGVPQSEPYAALLDALAVAGGTARSTEPKYYAASASDPSALLDALSRIAAQITGSCTLMLNQPPPDPSLVNVFFDGQPLPQGGPDGWTLVSSTVTVLGASCSRILDGSVLDVRVVAGCPTVIQ
jgi:hypothetical protein